MPLIDLGLLEDRVFVAGMCATFCFFAGNLSFYFVLTLYIQNGLGFSPFDAALTVMPLAFAFVAGSRLGGGRLIEGCVVQGIGLAGTALLVGTIAQPSMAMLMLPLAVFGYGQGMVLAPLFSAVLTQVRHAHAGSGAGILTTTQQVANGAGVVVVGAVVLRRARSGRQPLGDTGSDDHDRLHGGGDDRLSAPHAATQRLRNSGVIPSVIARSKATKQSQSHVVRAPRDQDCRVEADRLLRHCTAGGSACYMWLGR